MSKKGIRLLKGSPYHIIDGISLNKRVVISENWKNVDHFVPWSFVANDELWNLIPMESSLNSSKSNYLPDWNKFFYLFADNQFLMYENVLRCVRGST